MSRSVAALLVALIAAVGISAFASESHAQSWPQRPVRLIIPFGAGAGADIGARLFAEKLSAKWGKGVVVENRPGGDSFVAITAFTGANDDHVLLWAATGSFTVHPYQHDKLPYKASELAPISRVSNTILAIAASDSSKITTVAELVARAKENPGKLNVALVPGITEFVFDGFAKDADVVFTKVPYKDITQAATDLGEGRIDVMMGAFAIVRAQMQAGRAKLLAVNNHVRAAALPDTPTAVEAGYPSLEVEGLVGLFGPPSMPMELRERIAADIREAAADPAVGARLTATAQVLNPGSPSEFAAAIDAQRNTVAKIAQQLGIKAATQ
ncbi:MAG: Bug family tripartite tricarboxylate transporter substrate binding protein [Xanthobacteraceae bacterium]